MPPLFWEQLPRAVLEDHAPVFVLSTGRCGTALITRLLGKVPEALCYHTPQPELVYSERQAYEHGMREFSDYEAAILAARFELIADCVVRRRRYVETNFRITFFAPQLYALFPRARFVHLVRHPGAFVRSAVAREYYQGQYSDVGRIRPLEGETSAAWARMTQVEKCSWLWNETNRFIERFKQGKDPNRILLVRSEELFQEPQTFVKICQHCGISPPVRSKIIRQLRRPVNAQDKRTMLPRYEDWDSETKMQLRRWVTGVDKYGYEL